MSAVVAIQNATRMLTADEREHISGLIDNLKTKFRELNSEASKRDRAAKTELTNRNKLLTKIRQIEPHFEMNEGQSCEDLQTVLDSAKSYKANKAKEDKRRERLEKKWNDSGFEGECPEMDNDTLDAHIKTLLKTQRDEKAAAKKLQSQISSTEKKRQKMLEKLTELGLNPDAHSTLEDLQTLHTLHIESEKQRKKDEAAVKKFRKQLDDLILKHPDAGIKNVPNDAGPNTLETAVKNARDTRDLFKKEQKELEKLKKAQERADKKAVNDKKKNEEKAQKLANKAAGVKGVKKNGLYQAFTAWITDEIAAGNIDQSSIDEAGGKGKYNSIKWKEMSESEKKDPLAPWNQNTA